MRRLLLVSLTVFLASGLASLTTVFVSVDASQARSSGSSPPPAEGGTDAIPADPYSHVVDNASPGRFSASGWITESSDADGYGKDYRVAEPSDRAAQFRMKIPVTDYYTVYAWWAAGARNNAATRFGVSTTSGIEWSEVDQRIDGGFWVRIGSYEMKKGERLVRIEGDLQSKGRVIADAVMVARDALVGANGRTASAVDPDALASDPADGDATGGATFSAQSRRNPTGRDVFRQAKRHLGTRYGNRTCRINVQEDCSCHTRLVFKKFGYNLPDSPVSQWRMRAGKKFFRKSALRVGDLVFHDLNRDGRLNDKWVDHVSIWAGNGNIIHASNYHKYRRVVISEERWLRNFWGAKRLRLR